MLNFSSTLIVNNLYESFFPRLETIVYQKDIGTIAYRSDIVGKLAAYIASLINADPQLCERAAHLAKCDLATTLVTEFTDTQGIMGMHYAELDGEDQNVAEAIFDNIYRVLPEIKFLQSRFK